MVKIMIAPNAFKQSLSAASAAQLIAQGLARSGLDAEYRLLPIADGGNGTVEAFLAAGGERVTLDVFDPLLRPIQASYARLADGETAVIEMALASGLELLRPDELSPFKASTYGTGQLMRHALEHGARRIIVGLGGSATIDGGAGALQALGVVMVNAYGRHIEAGNHGLGTIVSLHAQQLDPRWRECEVICATDVTNPALGAQGAAAVFGAQKGASPTDIPRLEANLRYYFKQIQHWHNQDLTTAAGGGAAGAMAAGLLSFLEGRMVSGLKLLLEYNGFRDHLEDTALVITGEGQLDQQTLYGKGALGIAQLAQAYHVPTIALVGGLRADDMTLHEAGFQAVLPIVDAPMPLEEALRRAPELLERAALRLGYLLQTFVQRRISHE
jgi:glycerate kinase